MTRDQIRADINTLPENYKTADMDKLISRYVREKADVSCLRPYILPEQDFHRVYFCVALKQMTVEAAVRTALFTPRFLITTGLV